MNPLDCLLVAATVCGFLALVWAARLHYNLRTVSLLLTASRLPAAYANDITLSLGFHYPRPTTPQQTVVKVSFIINIIQNPAGGSNASYYSTTIYTRTDYLSDL